MIEPSASSGAQRLGSNNTRCGVEPRIFILLGCGEKNFTKKDFGFARQGDGGRFEIFFQIFSEQ